MPITGGLHVAMVIFVLATVWLSVSSARRAAEKGSLSSNTRTQAILMVVAWVGYNLYYLAPSRFAWNTSLPLHVCDLLGPLSAVAVAWSKRWARTALYFCGLALAGQAVVTPTGNQDPASLRFWLYWTLHAGIIALSALDLVVLRYRPRRRDYLKAVSLDLGYAAVIVPIDVFFGWNYGYLGNDLPGTTTILSFLGAWPWRIATMLTLVAFLQALMFLPWAFSPARPDGAP